MGVSTGLYQISAGYQRISRYFFYGLVIVGLLGTATGVFAQSQQQPQLTLATSNVKVSLGALYSTSITFATGTITVQGPWSGGALHFERMDSHHRRQGGHQRHDLQQQLQPLFPELSVRDGLELHF